MNQYLFIIAIIATLLIMKQKGRNKGFVINDAKGEALHTFLSEIRLKEGFDIKTIDIDLVIKSDSDFSVEKIILLLAMYDAGQLDKDPSTSELQDALNSIGYPSGISLAQYSAQGGISIGRLTTLQKIITELTTERGSRLSV